MATSRRSWWDAVTPCSRAITAPPNASATTGRSVSLLELLGREQTFALVLDDLHSADDASAEFVLHLLRRPPRSARIFWRSRSRPSTAVDAVARRRYDAAPDGRHLELRAALAPTPRSALLSPVSDEAACRRADQPAGGGQPAFPCRARAGGAAIPTGRLPPTHRRGDYGTTSSSCRPVARRVATAAAVCGRSVRSTTSSPHRATRSPVRDSPRRRSTISSRAAWSSSTADGRLFAFRHPLVRRAIYDTTRCPAWRLRGPWPRSRRAAGARSRASRGAPFMWSARRTVGDMAGCRPAG